MTKDTRLGFGLVGTGLIAPFHAQAIQASSLARLIAATDTDSTRLGKFTREFNCRGYATLAEMLENPEIHVVNILTPNHLHTEAVLAAARAGKHVLVEKPPAMSLREVDAMQQAGEAGRVKIGVVLQCRTRQSTQAIRKAVEQGRFGKYLPCGHGNEMVPHHGLLQDGCMAHLPPLRRGCDHSAGVPLPRLAAIPGGPGEACVRSDDQPGASRNWPGRHDAGLGHL